MVDSEDFGEEDIAPKRAKERRRRRRRRQSQETTSRLNAQPKRKERDLGDKKREKIFI
jgi:hypothetical protein